MCQLLCTILFQDQKIEEAGMLHVSGCELCIGPVSPEEISPAGSPDGTACVLVKDEPFKRVPFFNLSFLIYNRSGSLHINNGGRRKQASVQSQGSFSCQWYLQVSDGPLFFQFKKHIAGIVI